MLGLGKQSKEFATAATPSQVAAWRRQAEEGNAPAAFYLALHTLFVGEDADEAQKLFQQSAKSLPEAGFTLARFHLERGGPAGVGKAVMWMRAAADAGLAEAQFDLALLYSRGVGVPCDVAEAARLLVRAATVGHREARRRLADLAARDRVKWEDDERHDTWLVALVAEGHPGAMLLKARRLMTRAIDRGDGDELPAEVTSLLDQAAATDYAPARYARGLLYLRSGQDADREKGVALVRQAAEAGWAPAQLEMNRLLAASSDPAAVKEAAGWLVKAEETLRPLARGGDVHAALELGRLLTDYEGEAWEEGVRWLQHAAYAGLAAAQYELGCIHLEAEGLDEQVLGARLLRMAAEQNHADAQFELGKCYSLGQGMDGPSAVEAVRWFTLAAVQGHVEATAELEVAATEGNGMPKDEELAASLRKVLAEIGAGE